MSVAAADIPSSSTITTGLGASTHSRKSTAHATYDATPHVTNNASPVRPYPTSPTAFAMTTSPTTAKPTGVTQALSLITAPRSHSGAPLDLNRKSSTHGWTPKTHLGGDANAAAPGAQSTHHPPARPPGVIMRTTTTSQASRVDHDGSKLFPNDPTTERPTSRHDRVIAATGAIYGAAWVTGLVLAPTTPTATASGETIRDYYVNDGPQIVLQSSLIHGLAGIALAILAMMLPAATRSTPVLARTIRSSGVAAAVVSLIQVGIAFVAVASASSASPRTSEQLFDTLNRADTVKLILLAVFVTSATVAVSRAGLVGRWTRVLTAVLAVALPVGGLAFVIDHRALTATLYASLPLLLTWVGVIAWHFGRRRTA